MIIMTSDFYIVIFCLLNHSVIVITFGLAQSDPIKQQTLYCWTC